MSDIQSNGVPDIMISEAAPLRVVRPFGFLGLILSFIGIMALGSLLLALGALIWVGLAGLDGVQQAMGGLASVPDINNMRTASHQTQMVFYGITAASFVGFGLATLIFAWLRGGAQWRIPIAWHEPTGWPRGGALGLLLVLAPVYLLAAGFGIKLIYPEFRTWFFLPEGVAGLTLSFVTVAILAPWAEELIFRGWIYTSLRQSFDAGAGIVITALLFAIVHLDATRLYPLLIFIPGLVLTIIREKNGSAKASFLAHAIYNAMAWAIVFFIGNP